MLIAEYSYETDIKVQRREAYREGLAEGIEQGISQGIEQGIQQGIEQGIEQGAEQKAIETDVMKMELGRLNKVQNKKLLKLLKSY